MLVSTHRRFDCFISLLNLLKSFYLNIFTLYALIINSRLGGIEAPDEWQGGLNITYRLGPGFITEFEDW